MFIPHLEIALIIKRNFVQILRIFENLSPFSNQKLLSFYEEGSYIYKVYPQNKYDRFI